MGDHASLAELKASLEDCSRCVLGTTGARFVFGVGDEDARVMVIGEAPGFHEDQQGEPFVGAAGKLLDEALASIGLSRSPGGGVYITNVIKHRPPSNRDPQPDEVAACMPILKEQIRILNPEVIVTLGNHATKAILETEVGITKLRGRVFHRDARIVFPTFHPAAALRTPSVEAQLKADFRTLAEVLAERQASPGAAIEGGALGGTLTDPPAPPPTEQLELF